MLGRYHVSHFLHLLLYFQASTLAINLDCSHVVADKVRFDFGDLGGPQTLYHIQKHAPTITNTTFTFDLCRALKKQKDVPKGEDCPNGSRVCAIETLTNTIENVTTIEHTIPIAGEFSHTSGGALDPRFTRLRSSASHADREREGVRIELNGGNYDRIKQKAIIELVCPEEKGVSTRTSSKRQTLPRTDGDDDDRDDGSDSDPADDGQDEEQPGQIVSDDHNGKIKYISWDLEEDLKVLRIEWQTKFACESARDGSEHTKRGHWGFLTWFIIIAFMSVAAYLVFGTWLNYQRYSARGWDLVPHSETIRDVPYLLKDWVRRVFDTMQGSSSRTGYSAV